MFAGTVPGDIYSDLYAGGFIDNPLFGENHLNLKWIAADDWTYTKTFSLLDVGKTVRSIKTHSFRSLNILRGLRISLLHFPITVRHFSRPWKHRHDCHRLCERSKGFAYQKPISCLSRQYNGYRLEWPEWNRHQVQKPCEIRSETSGGIWGRNEKSWR